MQPWIWYKMVFDLAVLDGHGVQACNDAAMAILKRYDIRHSDIILSINDTTNALIATGKLIVSTDNSYNMHLANFNMRPHDQETKKDVQQGDRQLV
jgi:hypothetical protein